MRPQREIIDAKATYDSRRKKIVYDASPKVRKERSKIVKVLTFPVIAVFFVCFIIGSGASHRHHGHHLHRR